MLPDSVRSKYWKAAISKSKEEFRGWLCFLCHGGNGLSLRAKQIIFKFLRGPFRVVVVSGYDETPDKMKAEPSGRHRRKDHVTITSLHSGVENLDREYSAECRCAVKSFMWGPGVDHLPHDDLRGEGQGVLELPTAYTLRHHEDRGVKWFSVRATNSSFPDGMHGLRWVVEDGRAVPDLGQTLEGPDGGYEDNALVIERRGGKPVWVRAGVGSVVSPRFGWAAVAGSRFIAVYDLDLGVELLRAPYDPFTIGSLWLGVLESLLLVSFRDGCLSVVGRDQGQR